jgi:hypothetical protein
MRSVIYSMGVSLDGYVVGPNGGSIGSEPDVALGGSDDGVVDGQLSQKRRGQTARENEGNQILARIAHRERVVGGIGDYSHRGDG